MLMSPASCAEKIHQSRVAEIKEALDDIRNEHVTESAYFELIQYENNQKTITVKTNQREVVDSVEELLELTPAWRENIIIDYVVELPD